MVIQYKQSVFPLLIYKDIVCIHQHISCDSELIWLKMSWCLWKKTTHFWSLSDAKRQMALEWTLHLSTSWMWTISVQLLLGLILLANAAWTKFVQLDVTRKRKRLFHCPQNYRLPAEMGFCFLLCDSLTDPVCAMSYQIMVPLVMLASLSLAQGCASLTDMTIDHLASESGVMTLHNLPLEN